jgi:hypothetical protein
MSNTDGILTWTTQLDQTSTYPTFNCKTSTDSSGNPICQPTTTTTYIMTLYGPDTVTLNDSNDLVGCGCTQTNNAGGTLTPKGPPCFASSKKNVVTCDASIDTAFDNANDIDLKLNPTGTVQGKQCTAADNCPCADPDTCMGTIVIEMDETPAYANLTFPFFGSGDGIDTPGCQVTATSLIYNTFCVGPTTTAGVGKKTFSNLTTVGASLRSFTADIADFPPVPQAGFDGQWKIDNISCSSLLNKDAVYDSFGNLISPAVTFSTWTTDSGSTKLSASVNLGGSASQGGDTVTCQYHGHKNSK